MDGHKQDTPVFCAHFAGQRPQDRGDLHGIPFVTLQDIHQGEVAGGITVLPAEGQFPWDRKAQPAVGPGLLQGEGLQLQRIPPHPRGLPRGVDFGAGDEDERMRPAGYERGACPAPSGRRPDPDHGQPNGHSHPSQDAAPARPRSASVACAAVLIQAYPGNSRVRHRSLHLKAFGRLVYAGRSIDNIAWHNALD
jgi:hypothetical protein